MGKSTRALEVRKREHLKNTVKLEHKFARALQKYPEDTWEWRVLVELPLEVLDEYEIFFIDDLDTFENGYNTHPGGNWLGENNPRHTSTIYELWHPKHGIIQETLTELHKRSNSFTHIQELLRGNRQHIAGFVLPENKDKYNSICKTYDFYHPNHGVVSCSSIELFRNYKQYFKGNESCLYNLTGKKVKLCFGWCLAENKDSYEALLSYSHTITLTHPEHGTLTLKRTEFKKRFGLSDCGMTYLLNRRNKSSKGWTLPENKDIYKQTVDILTLTHPEFGVHTLTRKEFKGQFKLSTSILSQLALGTRKSGNKWALVEKK